MSPKIKSTTTKKAKVTNSVGVAHIQSTFNNTIITITVTIGNTIAWSSAGAVGFKGARKGTPFAAQIASERASRAGYEKGLRKVAVFVHGPGPGRRAATRAISKTGLVVTLFRETTGLPHNGCRPPKQRRL